MIKNVEIRSLNGLKRSETVKNGQERSRTVKNGQERSGTVNGQERWTVKNGQERSRTLRNGQERSGTVKNVQERSRTFKNGQERSGTVNGQGRWTVCNDHTVQGKRSETIAKSRSRYVHGTFTVRSRSRFKNERNTVLFDKTKAAYFIRLSVFMRKKLKLT